jgi:hypothetical protein
MFLGQTNLSGLQWLGVGKDAFLIVQSIVTSIGIVFGGVWTYRLFVKRREKFPRAKLEYQVQVFDYSADERHIRVGLTIKNESQVLLKIEKGHTWIQQIEPYASEAVEEFKERITDAEKAPYEARWPLIEERLHTGKNGIEVEPLEVHDLYMDFFVNKCFKKIAVYTFLENSAKADRHIGWTASTVVNLETGDSSKQGQGKGSDKPRPKASKEKVK